MQTEQQYRDQLTERNTLLLTIYQYMEKILGAEKATPVGSPSCLLWHVTSYVRVLPDGPFPPLLIAVCDAQRKKGETDVKPFTNFGVFHDNLISRLKSVSQIQLSFDKRVKDIENKFSDQMT